MVETTAVEQIPLEDFFGNPEKVQPQISPDGKRMSYIAPDDGVLNIWVGEIGGAEPRPVTNDRDRGIRQYAWAHDNRHLLYLQDKGGDENWRIYSVDLESGDIKDLTPFEGVQAQFVGAEKTQPHDVLIGLNRDNPQLHDVYHLDLRTGELTLREKNPGFAGWVIDHELQVRGAMSPRPDGGFDLLVRDQPGAEFRQLLTIPVDDALTTYPISFSEDGNSLLMVSSVGANSAQLVRKAIATGEDTHIAGDPRYDVADLVGVWLNPDTHEPEVAVVEKDRAEYTVLDASVEADIAAIRALQEGDFSVVDRDHANQTWLVAFTNDNGPVAYYSYDRGARKGTFLFHHQPALSKYPLANLEPFSFKARDGLEVHGYLTFPLGVERKNLPTVFWVHGGPWFRDTWGFNPVSQWLANRGYLAVLVNYRGSTGYGKDFTNAGDKEWGGKMHDDLIDAVAWLIEKGYSDPKKIAITGGSYGGYATLVGATFTPDVFCCAVAVVGPSNLKTFIETIPPYWQPTIALWKKRVGDPETEEEFLWSRSPLSRVDAIKIPMLIVHGANDPRVKQSESEQIVAAMKAKGIPHEYMLFPDEGHGFAKPENSLKFFGAMEKFLAEHVGGVFRS